MNGSGSASPMPDPAPAGPVVTWRDDRDRPHSLALSGIDDLRIGRKSGHAIALPWDAEVSRTHAQFEKLGSDWTIRDDGLSKNGTWVNGERLRGSRRLADGDTIRVGRTLLTVSASRNPDSLTTAGAEPGGGEHGATVAATVVHLCGELLVQHAGRRLLLPNRQGRLVFAYVMARPEHRVRREELPEVLWTENPPKNPGFNLNVILTRLRGVLGSAVVTGQATVAIDLGPDPYVDVEAAEAWVEEARRALAAAAPARAIEAAQAATRVLERPLLPEFSAKDWVIARQHELSGRLVDALETHARAALAIGGTELPVAERIARRLVAEHPTRESAYGLLMEALDARGNRGAAQDVYTDLRESLRKELGMPPGPALRSLYDRISELS